MKKAKSFDLSYKRLPYPLYEPSEDPYLLNLRFFGKLLPDISLLFFMLLTIPVLLSGLWFNKLFPSLGNFGVLVPLFAYGAIMFFGIEQRSAMDK